MSSCVYGAPVTCEQAYELVVQLLASDPQPVLPAELVRLRQQLETVLPERQQTAITEAVADHWTSQRSLPTPSSPDCSPLSAYHGSSRAQDHARRPVQPSYHEVAAQFIAICRRSKWSKHLTNSPFLALLAIVGSNAARKMSSACSHAL